MIAKKQMYSISSSRWELSKILDRVQFEGEGAILTRHNIPVAAIVPVTDVEKLARESKPARIRQSFNE